MHALSFLLFKIFYFLEPIFKPKLFALIKEGLITKKQIRADIVAGVVVGIVALPLAIAFAIASGLSPEKGIVTSIVAGIAVAFFGGSRVQIGGPTGTFIVIMTSVVMQFGYDGVVTCTLLAGLFLIMFGLLRLGALLKFIPQPLIIGFTSGVAVIIFSTQVKDALGLTLAGSPITFLEKWNGYIDAIPTANLWAIGVTVTTIIVAIVANIISKKINGLFVSIVLMTAVVAIFKLPVTTIETMYGEIPSVLSFSIPNIDFANIGLYIAPALTIALTGAIESLLSAVVTDGMIGSKHRSNTELIGQGIANLLTPLFGGIPATGAIARSATNVKNGGRTPLSGIAHSLTLLLIVLVFGGLAKLIPMATLAGVLIIVSYNMSEWRIFRSILKGAYFDIIILLSTFFITVLVEVTLAIEVGVILSALLFMKRMADCGTTIEDKDDTDRISDYAGVPKEIGIYEISGPFFFASAKNYCNMLLIMGVKYKVLIIRMRYVPFIDNTALLNLQDVVKTLRGRGIEIYLSGVHKGVKNTIEKRDIDLVHHVTIFSDFDDALKNAKEFINAR